MDEHVYLMAQFQYLEFENQVFPSSENFVNECEKWISKKEGDTLRSISLEKKPKSIIHIIQEWEEFKKGVQEEVAQWRSGKRTNLILLKDDFEKMNPLEREVHLLKIHWEWLSKKMIESETDIGLTYLILYLLQIETLKHKRKFNTECGMKSFKKHTHILQEE